MDGGGSKTDAALVREDGELLGFARGPLSHPHHIGIAASGNVLDALAAEIGAPADLAVLLVAGLDFPDEEEAYAAEAERRGWPPRSSSETTPSPCCEQEASVAGASRSPAAPE